MGPFDPDELLAAYATDRAVPHLRVNFIASIDGAATHAGLSGPLNDEADKQVFDTLRRLADVVLLGAGTARIEGYGGMRLAEADAAWRTAHGLPAHPVLALVSGRLDLDPASPLFTDAPRRPVVLTHAQSPTAARESLGRVADVVVCGTQDVDVTRARDALHQRGLTQILCEGGPMLLGALIAADAVDEMCLTVSPVLEGGNATRITRGSAQHTRDMRLAGVLRAGDMLMLRYLRASSLPA